MSIIKRPPEVITDPLGLISAQHQDQAAQYFALAHPFDPKGSYLHFDEWRFRLPAGLDATLAWSLIKRARSVQLTPTLMLGEPAISAVICTRPPCIWPLQNATDTQPKVSWS